MYFAYFEKCWVYVKKRRSIGFKRFDFGHTKESCGCERGNKKREVLLLKKTFYNLINSKFILAHELNLCWMF